MASIEQHLRVLELERGTSQEEIKQSYRRLVMVWHPDRFAHDTELRTFAENRCKQINLAYEFLRSVPPDQLKKEEPEPKKEPESKPSPSQPPPIQINDVQYRDAVVAQIVSERPRQLASAKHLEFCSARGKRWDIEFRVENKAALDSGVQLAMIFDSAKRVVRFPWPELIQVDFPMFALATICVRDFTFKGDFGAQIGKAFRTAGWDGKAMPPARSYFEAEYKLTKKAAEVDIERLINGDDSFLKDMRAWWRPKDLADGARWVTNRVTYARR